MSTLHFINLLSIPCQQITSPFIYCLSLVYGFIITATANKILRQTIVRQKICYPPPLFFPPILQTQFVISLFRLLEQFLKAERPSFLTILASQNLRMAAILNVAHLFVRSIRCITRRKEKNVIIIPLQAMDTVCNNGARWPVYLQFRTFWRADEDFWRKEKQLVSLLL